MTDDLLYIEHATILTPADRIDDGAVLIEGGRIAAVGRASEMRRPSDADLLDAAGRLLAPGFIDLQINGAFGHDFTEDFATIWRVAELLPRYGVTAFLPTVVTSPAATVQAAQAVLQAGPPPDFAGAWPLGLHVEGPFLNPAKRGAHNPAYLREPDVEEIEDWTPANGVLLVTLAPEMPGALATIAALRASGVVISAGHSLATFDQAVAGFGAGVTFGTHLFNAMPPLDHREPGLAGALLHDPRARFSVIADGVHVHPALVAAAWRAAGPDRFVLVTDAMAALGMQPGSYRLGEFPVTVDATSARLADGRLAGSVLRLDKAVRNLRQFTGCGVEEALAAVTINPARVLGIESSRGRIGPGAAADLVLLEPNLRVAATFAAGSLVYRYP